MKPALLLLAVLMSSAAFAAAPPVKAVTISPHTIAGGGSISGLVTLTSAPTTAVDVTLTSTSSVANIPGHLSIAAGQTQGTFNVVVGYATTTISCMVTAATTGPGATDTFTINPFGVSKVVISPNTVAALGTATGTVTLTTPAPPAGINVALKSGNPSVIVPNKVVVAGGATTATFPVSTTRVATTLTTTVTATFGTTTAVGNFTVSRTSDLNNSDWPKFRGSYQNRGIGTGVNNSNSGQALSFFQTLPNPQTNVSVYPSTAYYWSAGNLVAVSAAGNLTYTYPISDYATGQSFVVDSSRNAFYINTGGGITARNSTGGLRWTSTLSGILTLVPYGNLLVQNGSTLTMLNGSGGVVYTYTLPANNAGAGVASNGTVVYSTTDGFYHQVNTHGVLTKSVNLNLPKFEGGTGSTPLGMSGATTTSKGLTIITDNALDIDFQERIGWVFCLDLSGNIVSAEQFQQLPLDDTSFGAPAVAPDGSFALFTYDFDNETEVIPYYSATGTIQHIYSAFAPFGLGCSIGSDDAIYFFDESTFAFPMAMQCFNPNGSLRWYSTSIQNFPTPGPGSLALTFNGGINALDSTGTLAWLSGGLNSSPVLASNGLIYIGTNDGNLVALTNDGTYSVQWTYKIGGSVTSTPVVDSAGVIYVGSSTGNFFAINPDGTRKWQFAAGGAIDSSATVGYDGTVYFGGEDGNFYALKPSGSLKWKVALNGGIDASPAVDSSGNIYIGSKGGTLYSLTPAGTTNWSLALGAALDSSPVVGPNGIFAGGEDGKMNLVSTTGTLTWSFTTGAGIVSTPAVTSTGISYFGSDDGNLYALTPTGTLLWKFKTNGFVRSSPLLMTDGSIAFASFDTNVYAVNNTGAAEWSYQTRRSVFGSPTIDSNGHLFVGGQDGSFYVFYP